MELRTDEAILIRQYLLGEAAEQDRTLVEERLLTDGQYLNQLVRTEEELTDQYARGELSRHEQDRFENHFMNAPVRREGVAFAEGLHRYISSAGIWHPAARGRNIWPASLTGFGPRWRLAMEASLAGAVLLLLALTVWLLTQRAQLRRQIAEGGAERAQSGRQEQELKRQLDEQQLRAEDLARQLQSSQDKLAQMEQEIAGLRQPGQNRPEANVLSLALLSGLSRDTTGTRAASLSPGTRRLRLELKIDRLENASYRAEVQTVEGSLVWSRDALRARLSGSGNAVVITLPVTLLTSGDYLVALSVATAGGAYERIGTYHFRVLKN